MARTSDSHPRTSGLGECLGVLALLGVVAVEILVTYSRLPAGDLYHVSGSGLEGGASRVVVFLCFPSALIALAVLGIVVEHLPGRGSRTVALLAAAGCATVFWPGVVTQGDLDARPVNAFAALGVVVTAVVTAVAAQRAGAQLRRWRSPGDPARVVVAVCLLLVGLPWLAADLGFYLDGVPVLGRVFLTGSAGDIAPIPPPDVGAAVHHGHHHGLDGVLLCLSALALSRALGSVTGRGLRGALAGYLALMLAYGAFNVANDAWTEQVVKRGWADWRIPNVLEPRPTIAWGLLLLTACLLWLGWRAVPEEP